MNGYDNWLTNGASEAGYCEDAVDFDLQTAIAEWFSGESEPIDLDESARAFCRHYEDCPQDWRSVSCEMMKYWEDRGDADLTAMMEAKGEL